MKKTISFFLAIAFFCTSVFASSASQQKPFPYEQGVALTKNLLYLNARELSAGAGLNTLWSDTFKDSSQINSGSSSGYTARGASNYDVIVDTVGTDQIPTMTAASSPSGTASASGNVAAREPYKAMDKSGATVWSQNTTLPYWLKYDFGAGVTKTITKYSITGGATSAVEDPKTWTLEGSNDDSSWTVLDTRTAVASGGDHTARTYTFTNSTAYRYYRLNITALQSGTYCTIEEWKLFYVPTSAVVRSVTTTFSTSVSELMVFVETTLNSGSITLIRVSANGGTNWKTVTNNLEQVVSLGHSGTSIILEVTFTGNAELEFWGVSA